MSTTEKRERTGKAREEHLTNLVLLTFAVLMGAGAGLGWWLGGTYDNVVLGAAVGFAAVIGLVILAVVIGALASLARLLVLVTEWGIRSAYDALQWLRTRRERRQRDLDPATSD